jgi:hypothetical protein
MLGYVFFKSVKRKSSLLEIQKKNKKKIKTPGCFCILKSIKGVDSVLWVRFPQ